MSPSQVPSFISHKHTDAAGKWALTESSLWVSAVVLATFSFDSTRAHRNSLHSVACCSLIIARLEVKIFFYPVTALKDVRAV